MDYDGGPEASVSVNDVNIDDPEVDSSKVGNLESVSSDGVIVGELRSVGEVFTRVELDLACASEKLVNLNVLMMHVATKESDFEALASKEEKTSVDSAEKAMEFILLSGILDSEVSELDKLMAILQAEITNAQGLLSLYTCLGETFTVVEDKLCDSEQSLKQLQDQISEIRMQSLKFQRTFSCFDGEENWNTNGVVYLEDDKFSSMNVKINLQTVEQQRHILRMLEKSLAREMDLEKKLTESKQIEEDMKLRLLSSEQEAYCMEEEAADAWERWLQADNASEVLMGISKELLGKLHVLQFNLNGSVQREAELRLKLDGQVESRESSLRKLESSNAKINSFLLDQTAGLKDSLKEAEDKLILADSEAFTLREKVSSLEEQHTVLCSDISELENVITDLKEKVSKAETRAENAEAKSKLLTETNMELNEEIGLLKSTGIASETVDSLERKLRESDTQLQHAAASAEASLEKQHMLYSTIYDMESVIKDLKQRILKAESRTDSAEDNCIRLSESNALLTEELSFLRGRLACMEASLHQAEELKIATATDIGIRSKVLTSLVVQLAFERERLHKQISSLAVENKTLVLKLQTNKCPSVVMGNDDRGTVKDFMPSKHGLATGTRESKEEADELSDSNCKLDETQNNVSVGETEVGPTDSTSEFETARRIDAGVLSFKHFLMAMLILLISVAAYFLLQQDCPF
ncbi:WPP domain-interacting tail-anchored protein 1 [Prunus yedoensis var. nudiflora]|uniref:WPP domain-interacting tail-anchored protein 1 n=1 Tax=Prunus yedoensis var. nudiflora TaxID=2094558 RepID=A0A314URA7_PRUYE|nr:WPP domain-interacting tail-anchored protein 1 [Prunus yedoensis var. nudiflora]